jgi:NAD(P)-dependent dehydrogenase (short-subunit alcohol dehydrogenase family)
MSGLTGKVAVVTGGSSGIGLAIAQRFVAEGAYVFITGRRQSALDKAKALIGKNVTTVRGDATSTADLDRLFETVLQEKGSSTSWSPIPVASSRPSSGKSPRTTSTRPSI